MKVSSTEVPPRQVSLDIEVDQTRVDQAMEQAYRQLAGRVEVPGFRRGKAPRTMVERVIGRERIMDEALEKLVPQVVGEAIEQEKVEPYTRPSIESIELDPLRVRAVVGLSPKVELGDYKAGLGVTPEPADVGDDQVEAVLQRLRESYAQWTPVERAVQSGDRVGLDLWVGVEGRETPLHDSKDAEYVVDAEGAQPVPGFAEKLIGMQAGNEQSFSVQLPDDYRQTEVAGQPAEVRVNLHWIKERQLPEIDDAFAQQVGEYADATALREAVQIQVREREEQRAREQLEEASLNKLVEISTIEFPPQLIDHQARHMFETFARSVERQGLQLQQYLRLVGKDQAAFELELRAEAESNIRRSLALDAFADAEQIGVEQAEVADEVRRAAAGTEEAEAVEALAMNNPNTLQRVEGVTRERKALNRLIELATANGHTPAQGKSTAQTEEKTAAASETSDTEGHGREEQPPVPSAAEEEQGTA